MFNDEPAIERAAEQPPAPEPSSESAHVLSIPPVLSASQRLQLSELIRLYITEVTEQRGQDIARGIEKNLLRFLEIVTDKPIDQYSVEDKLRYRDVLQRMPKCINRRF